MGTEGRAVRRLALVVALSVAGLSAGCASKASKAGAYYLDDGPGKVDERRLARLMKAPDPVPVPEKLRARANRPYTVMGQRFVPMTERQPYRQQGVASWYGQRFHGKPTAIGETYDMYGMTAAHPTLPLPSYVRVRSLENGRSVVVRVNDRGPFLRGRLIDLSFLAASKLGYVKQGHARVEVELLDPGGSGGTTRQAGADDAQGATGQSGLNATSSLASRNATLPRNVPAPRNGPVLRNGPDDPNGRNAPDGRNAPESGNDATLSESERLHSDRLAAQRAQAVRAAREAGDGQVPSASARPEVTTRGVQATTRAGGIGAVANRSAGNGDANSGRGQGGDPRAGAGQAAAAAPDEGLMAGDERQAGAETAEVRFGPASQRTVNGHLVFEGWGAEHQVEPEAIRRIDLGSGNAADEAGSARTGRGTAGAGDAVAAGTAAASGQAARKAGGEASAGADAGHGQRRAAGAGREQNGTAGGPASGGGWFLQLGVFRQMENALRAKREQQANAGRGDPPVDVAHDGGRYVVRQGPYGSEAAARQAADTIADRSGQRPAIRKL